MARPEGWAFDLSSLRSSVDSDRPRATFTDYLRAQHPVSGTVFDDVYVPGQRNCWDHVAEVQEYACTTIDTKDYSLIVGCLNKAIP